MRFLSFLIFTFDCFFCYLADVRIFDNHYCRGVYDTIFDPNTEICAGDYDKKADTMVRENI